MCGIAGWIDWEEDLSEQAAIIEAMIERLAHRGPDAHAIWLSPRAALAHHRLIVIDPVGGGQPMIYQSGEQTYVITYNGELYNFRELRAELETRGHTFQTNSDTEVLLHTYIEWGEECTRHLNGIFAFGIWDEGRQQLFLARDHLGVKPLFYTQRGSAVLFASEIKALLLPMLLDRKDRMSMATGFEVRVPFCDYRLVEYVWNIPWEMKAVDDMEKSLLRCALADVLPSDVLKRKKSPYPTSQHPQYQQKLREWVLQIVNDSSAPIRPFLNIPLVRQMVEGHLPDLPGAFKIAPMEQIIQINAWLQEYCIRIR